MTPTIEETVDANQGGKPYCNVVMGPLLFAYALPAKDENTPRENVRTDWALDSATALEGSPVPRGGAGGDAQRADCGLRAEVHAYGQGGGEDPVPLCPGGDGEDGFGLEHAFCKNENASRARHLLMQFAHNVWQVFNSGFLENLSVGCRKVAQGMWGRKICETLHYYDYSMAELETVYLNHEYEDTSRSTS